MHTIMSLLKFGGGEPTLDRGVHSGLLMQVVLRVICGPRMEHRFKH